MFRVAAYRSNSIALTVSPDADPQYVYNDNSIYLPSFDDLKSTRTDLNNKELQNMMIGTLKYASGRTMTDGAHPNILDWALVSVSEGTLKKDREEYKKDYKVNSEPVSSCDRHCHLDS